MGQKNEKDVDADSSNFLSEGNTSSADSVTTKNNDWTKKTLQHSESSPIILEDRIPISLT